jgi:hypothetical protein
VPILFLVFGLTSLTSVVLAFYNYKSPLFASFNGNVSTLIADVLCGAGFAVFLWSLMVRMKGRRKGSPPPG